MPEMDETSRKRPLCYDPSRNKFILYDDIVSGKEKIIPVDSLSEDDLKKLVIKRWRVLPKRTTVQAISGPPLSRDKVIRAIERDEPFGRLTLEADKSYLRDLLDEIQRNLE
jgi:hypothetical protein